jgi:small subunit ribosomal protein S1
MEEPVMSDPTEPTPPTPPAPENAADPAADAARLATQPPPPENTADPAVDAARLAAQPPRPGPPRPGAPRPGGSTRPFPQGNRPPREKPLNPGGAPPLLRDFGANKPNKRELDAQIEEELNQAMAGVDVSAAVAETQQKPQPPGTPGQRKKGRIVGIHGKDVFVDVPGGRSQGVLPIQQFEGKTPQDRRRGRVRHRALRRRQRAAHPHPRGVRPGRHRLVERLPGMIVEARVTGTNKNKTGLTVEVNGIKGFLPASQLDLYRVEDLDQFLNQRMKVHGVEVNPAERNLIVSRRALLERERAQKAEQFWATIKEGQVRKGIVRSVKPFGAFVDLGGADGLIPISEFSWQRVNDPTSVVKVGQQVEVYVSRVDFEARKIGLSEALTHQPVGRVRGARTRPGRGSSGR